MNLEKIIKRNRIFASGQYVMPAIEPHCQELRIDCNLLGALDNGQVVLQDMDMARMGSNYYVTTDLKSFVKSL